MALPQIISPAPARKNSRNASSPPKANPFSVVRDREIFNSRATDSRGFVVSLFIVFLTGLLGLLLINTLLTQDAFVLQRLKQQTNVVNDQRDAVLQLLAAKSSPNNLAAAANKLGMIPALNPEFITLSPARSNTSLPVGP